MSATLQRETAPWQTRPGWGIVVDLTPPEVVAGRQVREHRRLIGLCLVLVLIACVGAVLLGRAHRDTAQDEFNAEQSRTIGLNADLKQYADVTAMQDVTDQVDASLASAMSTDVDVVNLSARILQALPGDVTIGNLNTLLTAADSAGDAETTDATTTASIGTVTITGNAASVDAVTPFVSALIGLQGVTDVVPTSVNRTDTGATYSITMNLTDELYTERYALEGTS